MKIKVIVGIVILAGAGAFLVKHWPEISSRLHVKTEPAGALYYCPMHPQITSDRPGECSICHMSLVKRKEEKPAAAALYYCPMHPQITSDKPGECPICHMSLVKREEQKSSGANSAGQAEMGVTINPRRQQLIGVKKETVQLRELTGRIDTVGRIAHLPNLYVAQQEYLQAVRYRKNSRDTALDKRPDLLEISKSKLLAMGMSETEIQQIELADKPEESLYLPENEQMWVMVTVYEQDADFVKEGQPVEVEVVGRPGTVFTGKIVAISPILDAATRTLQVRALVNNPGNQVRMEASVNVRILFSLGQVLAVSRDAVMHTGMTSLVYVVKADDQFIPRPVELGAQAGGYYEIRKGLQAGEVVVTSGNFLIDSESKLNSALGQGSGSAEQTTQP